MADSFDHCEALVRDADRDRYLATLYAPPKNRRALYALYAFDLELARVPEVVREPMAGEIRLQWWRDALGGAGWGEVAANPVAAALRDSVLRYRLPVAALIDLIDARGLDLDPEPPSSVSAFEDRAARTGGAVMVLASRILADGRDPGAGDLCRHLGIADEVATLIRHLPRRASRGAIDLPADVIARHGVEPADVFAGRTTPALSGALDEMRALARGHLAAARGLAVPAKLLPALLPAALIKPALAHSERRSYDVFTPTEVAPWRRQWRLWRAARRGLARYL